MRLERTPLLLEMGPGWQAIQRMKAAAAPGEAAYQSQVASSRLPTWKAPKPSTVPATTGGEEEGPSKAKKVTMTLPSGKTGRVPLLIDPASRETAAAGKGTIPPAPKEWELKDPYGQSRARQAQQARRGTV